MPRIKVFNPARLIKPPTAHQFAPPQQQPSRLSDLVILLFGMGLGVLLFALIHDLRLRRAKSLAERTCVAAHDPESQSSQSPSQSPAPQPAPPAPETLRFAHSHHLATHVGTA